ncbi:16S rRNA (cytosine(1402)-N(4))-methyltransferase [Corallococcus sp. H22C18031201]|uniref:16S rRNA (cytosine(1402)-N(4))-methyltransferase RsmH n=1 Tax=Citreicoccus inhibens TaxID=2849499 RepID=UPI000E73AE16|nr:16S rRNA (cytosine(1402)-N(4))-methyltransferase RsmH [Citreicoccus inhibens]MBU8899234.1 16S rRNA (cytosine(1402)-N(4))-methyltransferase RsmH [Citreicoccus inhibens]RJS25721.1 16S rRNA (cytosine(1402)-N(4))-methyltransferase [Corallococcus sp. H22C18031201]
MDFQHQTVLLQETVSLLQPGAGKVILDGTLGGGGHSEALLAAGATVVGVDRDPVALAAATQRVGASTRFQARQGNFGDLLRVAADLLPVDGVLVDLGVSSPQLDVAERGFSFSKDGPLDMRMGPDGPTAAELIASTDERDLAFLLKDLGEEPFARPIARELKRALPTRTLEAAEVVKRAVPRKAWPTRIHVATRTFQALRMAVNGELEALDALLAALPKLLKVGGRAAVISFHSLEDRKVKEAFRSLAGQCTCPPGLPVCACGGVGDFALLTKKAVAASEQEIEANPRSRSAHLRGVEKIR